MFSATEPVIPLPASKTFVPADLTKSKIGVFKTFVPTDLTDSRAFGAFSVIVLATPLLASKALVPTDLANSKAFGAFSVTVPTRPLLDSRAFVPTDLTNSNAFGAFSVTLPTKPLPASRAFVPTNFAASKPGINLLPKDVIFSIIDVGFTSLGAGVDDIEPRAAAPSKPPTASGLSTLPVLGVGCCSVTVDSGALGVLALCCGVVV